MGDRRTFLNDKLWPFLRRWAGPLLILVAFLVILGIFWSHFPAAGSATGTETVPEGAKNLLRWLSVALLVIFVGWFLHCFTGKLSDSKITQMVQFCYCFTVISLLGPVALFVFSARSPLLNQLMARSPVGVVLGCVEPPRENAKSVPVELKCDNQTDQWLINIGGAVDATVNAQKPPGETGGSSLPDQYSRVGISGGLVVPLYFVVLALIGGAVSMTRRVPEYQRRARREAQGAGADREEPAGPGGQGSQGTPEDQGDKGAKNPKQTQGEAQDPISQEEARECMIFQIMQVISAPLIAITAYYLIDPGSRAATVVLGFSSGFASETILLAIRALVDKLKPELGPKATKA